MMPRGGAMVVPGPAALKAISSIVFLKLADPGEIPSRTKH